MAVAVSSASARIGDALSTYHDGIISTANEPARAKGVTIGMKAAEAARLMLG
jgi:nucleotidyltransferase/DNA polymerase involved in DNA repair